MYRFQFYLTLLIGRASIEDVKRFSDLKFKDAVSIAIISRQKWLILVTWSITTNIGIIESIQHYKSLLGIEMKFSCSTNASGTWFKILWFNTIISAVALTLREWRHVKRKTQSLENWNKTRYSTNQKKKTKTMNMNTLGQRIKCYRRKRKYELHTESNRTFLRRGR